MNIEYANAYSEVLEILKYVSQEDFNKIPKERIELFKTNCNKNYGIEYNPQKTLDEQNISKKAKTIIAILYRDYWATDLQREKIKAKEEYDRQNNKIIVYKETLIKRVINKILNWLGLK